MFADGRAFKAAVAGFFLAGSVSAPVAGASETGCLAPHDTQPTRTFEVEVRAARDVYQLGEKARFRVKVTRVLHGEVVGPAEGAHVGVFVTLDDVLLTGDAVTDTKGRAVVKVLLRRYAPTGFADVTTYARKETADLPCHWEYEHEFGDVEEHDLFRVVR